MLIFDFISGLILFLLYDWDILQKRYDYTNIYLYIYRIDTKTTKKEEIGYYDS